MKLAQLSDIEVILNFLLRTGIDCLSIDAIDVKTWQVQYLARLHPRGFEILMLCTIPACQIFEHIPPQKKNVMRFYSTTDKFFESSECL